MPAATSCASWPDFLVSLSPALTALLSATALLVASRARTTSATAQRTSQAALETYKALHASSSVIVSDEVAQALRSASSKRKASSE